MDPQQNQQPPNQSKTSSTPIAVSATASSTLTTNEQSRPRLVYVSLVLAILLSPVGLVVSIIAWRKISKQSLKGKGLAIASTIIGLVLSLISLYFYLAFKSG